MINNILNLGIAENYTVFEKRRVRTSNLVALIVLFVMICYSPIFIYYEQPIGFICNCIYILSCLLTLYLNRYKKHGYANLVMLILSCLYLASITVLFGSKSNLHFFLLVVCMLAVILFDKQKTIQLVVGFATVLFFSLVVWINIFEPFIFVLKQTPKAEMIVGSINLFILFTISILFVFFVKRETLNGQRLLVEQKNIVELKNKYITDSLNYAQRIQNAMLPTKTTLDLLFPERFVIYRPKDLVSGDFYWVFESTRFQFIAVGDCTGHGVPGCMLSVLGINLLTEIVKNKGIEEPSSILDELRIGVLSAFDLEGKNTEYKDGMDISIVRIDRQNQFVTYSGANSPIYHITNLGLTEYKPNKQPVGFWQDSKPFTQEQFAYKSEDLLILFTDGYADQFGGQNDKKFRYKPFRELIFEHKDQNLESVLIKTHENWKGNLEQVDDICVVGINL